MIKPWESETSLTWLQWDVQVLPGRTVNWTLTSATGWIVDMASARMTWAPTPVSVTVVGPAAIATVSWMSVRPILVRTGEPASTSGMVTVIGVAARWGLQVGVGLTGDRQTDKLTDWLTDWFTDWLTCRYAGERERMSVFALLLCVYGNIECESLKVLHNPSYL